MAVKRKKERLKHNMTTKPPLTSLPWMESHQFTRKRKDSALESGAAIHS